MANSQALKGWAEPLRTAVYSDITGTLTALGDPYANPVRIYFFTNNTDAVIYVSWNGTDNMFAVIPGNSITIDVCANQSNPDGLYIGTGDSTYIAYATAPTTGSVYLSLVYGTSGPTI